METSTARLAVGVVVERRAIDHPWRKWRWRTVEIVPGLVAGGSWRLLRQGPGWVRYAAGAPELELHRKATADFKLALSATPPQLYAVLRAAETEPVPFRPFLVTASPWEAQAYQESGDDLIDAVPMPDAIAAWIEEFVARHHVDQPFFKRRRNGSDKGASDASDFERVGSGGGEHAG
jgi:hypothetical protein